MRNAFLYILLKIGGIYMVDIYVALIVAGRRTIDKVLPGLRDEVLADLNAIGLDGYGKPLV